MLVAHARGVNPLLMKEIQMALGDEGHLEEKERGTADDEHGDVGEVDEPASALEPRLRGRETHVTPRVQP